MATIKNRLQALQPGLNALFGAAYKGLKPGMNVSELIAELGKIYLEYGDLPINIIIAGPMHGIEEPLAAVFVKCNKVELFGNGD